KNYLCWILFSNVIAWPMAYFVMNKWLQNFAYRIDMSWWMFGLAGGLVVVIALLTVSWQAIRAATANLVEALRYE
ncbi:MAG: ABC transporter permease, partial [Candidatus Hodarchaeota archaeon]